MISARFFGDDVLESCLHGHRMFDGSGDPPESVARVQRALSDIGYDLAIDGLFGPQTGATVSAYKSSKGIVPADPVVGPQTMAALDADFQHELFDATADNVAGTRFDLGTRSGTRNDFEDGAATCEFQNGIGVEVAHARAYAIPAAVMGAWNDAGGIGGAFGQPTDDPVDVDGVRAFQEFSFVAYVFGGPEDLILPIRVWEASISGGSLVGFPVGAPQPVGTDGTTFTPHDAGVVLDVPGALPQPLPQAVFDLWLAREQSGMGLGPPAAFAFPGAGGVVYPFLFGNIDLSDGGVASASASLSSDLERYFQPADDALQLSGRVTGCAATPLIGGADAFAAMRADILSTSGANDFIYVIAWHCNVDLQLVPSDPASTLRMLLADRARDGVQIRALLWAGDPVPAPPPTKFPFVPGIPITLPWQLLKDYVKMKGSRRVNEPAARFINQLRKLGLDAAAILDGLHRPFGSHHQKAVIVGAGGRLFAHIGGIEPNADRLLPTFDELGSPLFDTEVRLEDAGAAAVLETFVRRWNRHPARLDPPLRGGQLPVPLPAGGSLAVQVSHTYAKGFPFPTAVQTAATALSNAILTARQFVYVEDQYGVGSGKMFQAIDTAMRMKPGLVAIVMLAAEDSVVDLPDLPFRRRAFLGPLKSRFGDRFLVFERLGKGSPTGETAYVHSKLMIIDDEALIIGSVNSNRRAWFHDSEIQATIVDSNGVGGTLPGTRGWVREFRCTLWSRHLDMAPAILGDFTTALGVWKAVNSTFAFVRQYDIAAAVPRYLNGAIDPLVLSLAWNTIEDPG